MGPTGAKKNLKRGTGERPETFQSTFDETHFCEKIKRPAALYLRANHADFFKPKGHSENDTETLLIDDGGRFKSWTELDFLTSFLEKAQNGDSFLTTYAKAHKDVTGDGRWFAQGSSLQNCPSKLRATLCAGEYIDLDMENAGPTILSQLCAKLEIECPTLDDYVEHREERLKEFEPYLDRGQAKNLIIRLMNGGHIHENERDKTDGNDWLEKFIAEGWKIRRRIAGLAEYSYIKDRFKPQVKDRGLLLPQHTNVDAKCVSAIIFPLENQMLESFYRYFQNAGIVKDRSCVLTYDGIMITDNKSNREHLTSSFLHKASLYVKDHVGIFVRLKIKEFTDIYQLPDDYESIPENFFVVSSGDDAKAADILVETAGERLKKCGERFFFNHAGVIYVEGMSGAKSGILNLSKKVTIVVDAGGGKTSPYSQCTKTMKDGAAPRILADPSLEDDNFVKNMWAKNLGYLSYTNGVYSFQDNCLLTFDEAKQKGIYFVHDCGRAYNAVVDGTVKKDFLRRVIESFMPGEEQRKSFLNSLSRALAGHIEDKTWFVMMGMRNCGKGIFVKLLQNAFGNFIHTTNASNLLSKKYENTDAAKAQSWIKPLEWTRIAVMQEMKIRGTMCGDTIKKVCSNGDSIEVRTNHKDEVQIQCQCTLFIFVNDIPNVSSPDAYQTMQAYKLPMEFKNQSDITDLLARGETPPTHWLAKDSKLDEYIRGKEQIDAFTSIIFEAYTAEMQSPPQCVKDDTSSVKGDACVSIEERFSEIILQGGKKEVLFYPEIQTALEAGGLGFFSPSKIDTLVTQLYNIKAGKPSRKNSEGKSIQGRGFWGLQIADNNFNENDERLKKAETLRQTARLEYLNANLH